MQKWEYLRITAYFSLGGNDYTIKVNGRDLSSDEIYEDIKGMDVVELSKAMETPFTLDTFLNKLGKDGWELISVTGQDIKGESQSLYLKRPLG